jgi:Y_Y_Y domain/Two component regulator propeller
MSKTTLIIFLFILASLPKLVPAQVNISGDPIIRYIPPSEYNGGPQIFSILQNKQGVMYFGSNDGMIEYDGTNWEHHPLNNHTIVRSLALDKTGRIYYAGGQFELGFFEPDSKTGKLTFLSLKKEIKIGEQNFEDTWRVFPFPNNDVYFNMSRKILHFGATGEVTIIYPKVSGNYFEFAFQLKDDLFVFEQKTGLTKVQEGQMVVVDTTFKDKPIAGILPLNGDTMLLVTQEDGVFSYVNKGRPTPWCTPALQNYLKSSQVYCAIKVRGGYAFGTKQDGLLVLDNKGRPLLHVNREKGLQNDNIRCIFEDRNGNLWLGLDNGIAFISTQSPWKRLQTEPWLNTIAFASAVHENRLYLATGKGVYSKKLEEFKQAFPRTSFEIVKGSEGEAWSLTKVGSNNALLLGHHSGTFSIENDMAVPVNTSMKGGWTYIEVPGHKDLLIGGFYQGLALFKRAEPGTRWKFIAQINGFDESCRVMQFDEVTGELVVSHVYKGLFFLKLSKDFKHVNSVRWVASEHYPGNFLATDSAVNVKVVPLDETNLPSLNQINIFKNKIGEVVFATEKGIYAYSDSDFFYETMLNSAIGDSSHVTWLLVSGDKTWYIANGRMGLLEMDGSGNYQLSKDNFFHKMDFGWVQNFENIYPVSETELLVGTPEGFLLYDKKAGAAPLKPTVLIRKIETLNQKWVLFNPIQRPGDAPIEVVGNDIVFTVACPSFENPSGTKFRYFLEGYDSDTSDWTTISTKAYTNLHKGTLYTFHVWAKDDLEQGSEAAVILVHVNGIPAWLLVTGLVVLAAIVTWLFSRRKTQAVQEELQLEKEGSQEKDEDIEDLSKDQLLYEKELERGKDLLKDVAKYLANIITSKKADDVATSIWLNRIGDTVKKMEELKGSIFLPYEEAWVKRLKEKHMNLKNKKKKKLSVRDVKFCYWLRKGLSKEEIMSKLKIGTPGTYDTALTRLRQKFLRENEQGKLVYPWKPEEGIEHFLREL